MPTWVKLNRHRTGVGRFYFVHGQKAPLPNCKCGAAKQTADHALTTWPIHRAPHGAQGQMALNDQADRKLVAGPKPSLPASDPGSRAAWNGKRINFRSQSSLCLVPVISKRRRQLLENFYVILIGKNHQNERKANRADWYLY